MTWYVRKRSECGGEGAFIFTRDLYFVIFYDDRTQRTYRVFSDGKRSYKNFDSPSIKYTKKHFDAMWKSVSEERALQYLMLSKLEQEND